MTASPQPPSPPTPQPPNPRSPSLPPPHPAAHALAAALAEGRAALGQRPDLAEARARQALELAPGHAQALVLLGAALRRQGRLPEALAVLAPLARVQPQAFGVQLETGLAQAALGQVAAAAEALSRAVALNPGSSLAWRALGAQKALLSDEPAAAAALQRSLAIEPGQPQAWVSLGHALKTLGRQAEAVAAYRRAIALAPGLGEAYWSLANLKTVAFAPQDRTAMAAQLARPDLAPDDRVALSYALGKALEDMGDYEGAFARFAAGAALVRAAAPYDAAATSAFVDRSIGLYTQPFFAARAGAGCAAADPIFVVGLPRSGSTLVEQILASHSRVEGANELAELTDLAREVALEAGPDGLAHYPAMVAALEPARLRALGEAYLARTRRHRRTARPLFVDKFPGNVLHLGLIHLILPNAKIIDARRHPMAACLSGFKQLFAQGQAHSYDLTDLGRYYRDYARLTAHFDAVLPGRVHRVAYEALVGDPQAEVARLLAYCGLAFEPACLAFHQTDRAVRTASSEQVRQPLFTEAIDHWRHYAPWLSPLEQALGDSAQGG